MIQKIIDAGDDRAHCYDNDLRKKSNYRMKLYSYPDGLSTKQLVVETQPNKTIDADLRADMHINRFSE